MNEFLLFSLMLSILSSKATAQEEVPQTSGTPTPTASLTPEMIASSVSAFYSSLATTAPQQPGNGPSAGDVGSSAGSGGEDEGASGHDSGSITLSQNGMIAIIVVIVIVCVFGIASAVLWYIAKKRSWEVRKKIRSSARRVATALTPRRSTFPKDVQNPRKSTRGLTRINESNIPRSGSMDVEKATPKPSIKPFDMDPPPKKSTWASKLGR